MLGNSVASFLLNQVQRFAIGAMIGPAAVTVGSALVALVLLATLPIGDALHSPAGRRLRHRTSSANA
jgi:hypothetical protein